MLKIVAIVEQHERCPLYSQGDAMEFVGPAVAGFNGAPVCAIAVQNLSKAIRRIRDKGDAPESHSASFCGGCEEGKAWFGFRKIDEPDLQKISTESTRFVFGALPRTKLFAGLSNRQLAKLVPFLTEHRVKEGETVIRKGDPGVALYIIVDGQFDVISMDEHGTETRLAVLGHGECFGEMSLISGDPVSATVRAQNKGMLLVLVRDDFERMLSMIPSISITLSRILAQRLAKVSAAIVDDLRRGMTGRLEHIPPPDLVQAMNVSGLTGTLTVQHEGRTMNMYLLEGQIQELDLAGRTDEEAFYEFVTWKRGNFRFEPNRKETSIRSIRLDTVGLLLEGMRRIDETTKVYRKE